MDLVKRTIKRLANYKWRFAPTLYTRIAREGLVNVPKTIDISIDQLDSQLKSICTALCKSFPDISFHKPITSSTRNQCDDVLFEHLGFKLERRPSTIEGGGMGIFVAKGSIPSGRVASIYPGTIYDPWDTILLQSINNHFVLRCQDGVNIDGNDKRLSRFIHRSCVFRDLSPRISDITWLTKEPFNFITMGQYINNETPSSPHNVQYVDLDIDNWPARLRPFLPYAIYNPQRSLPLRVVLLVTVRTVHEGEELLSAYISK